MRVNKRPFMLAEVIVAIALITIVGAILIRPHISILRSQKDEIESLAIERAADLAMGEVRQLLYENRIAWGGLRGGEKQPKHHSQPLSPVTVHGLTFQPTLHLEIAEQKTKRATDAGQPKRDYRLLTATITLPYGKTNQVFTYKVNAKRITPKVRA